MGEQEPLTVKDEYGLVRLTEAGHEHITPLVTSMNSDVFAFTHNLSPLVQAAALARYSRSRSGARELIASEFSGEDGRDERLLHKVTQEFGDESVEQLYSPSVAVEGASMVLCKEIEWHRPGAAYLEKSTRYVPYTEKDDNGEYKYVTPPGLSSEETEVYKDAMDRIFDNYCEASEKLMEYVRERWPLDSETSSAAWMSATKAKALDVARGLLPASAKSNVGIHASAQAFNNLVMRLRGLENDEAREAGDKILHELREVTPVFFTRTDRPDRGGHISYYQSVNRNRMKDLANRHLPEREVVRTKGQTVDLRRYSPDDEFELLPYMLFDVAPTGYSIEDIKDEVASLTYEEKIEIFETYMGQQFNRRAKPGRAIEQADYTWEFTSDFGAFRDLQRHRTVDDLRWQPLTVEHGFDINPEVIDAGLEELFRDSIQLSEDLFEYLHANGNEVEAQYATLLGHKIHWTMKTNGRSNNHMFQLRSTPQGHPSYRETVQNMYRQVEKVHPHLARLSMQHMDLTSSEEIGRMKQEKAAEEKRKSKQ